MSILKIKDSQGNWISVPTIKGDKGNTGNGISSAILNDDYTLTLTFTDGTTYKTPSIRGEKGQTGDTPTITASKTRKTTSIYVDGSEIAQIEDGTDGTDGIDGYSPTASVSKSGKTATITITDKNGTTSAQVEDGEDGADGVSPTVTITPITGGHRITITDADGEHSADVMDGTGNVDDVQINGTSIVEDSVANVPIASTNNFGIVKTNPYYGIEAYNGTLYINNASESDLKAGTNDKKPLTSNREHISTFYGLAKAAGDTTQSQSSNAVGTYTDEAKVAIQKMLGIYEAPWELIREDTFTNAEEADHVIDVDANGEPFELTDIRIIFWLPKQENVSSKKDTGRISFVCESDKEFAYLGEWTQAENGASRGAWAEVLQKGDMIETHYTKNSEDINTSAAVNTIYRSANAWNQFIYAPNGRVYTQVVITKVLGTGNYRLYGRRKWQ